MFVIFILIGHVITSITVFDDPNLNQQEIFDAKECATVLGGGGYAMNYVPFKSKPFVTKKVGDILYVEYYAIYKIPLYIVLVNERGECTFAADPAW